MYLFLVIYVIINIRPMNSSNLITLHCKTFMELLPFYSL
jgi:hypothetical protein